MKTSILMVLALVVSSSSFAKPNTCSGEAKYRFVFDYCQSTNTSEDRLSECHDEALDQAGLMTAVPSQIGLYYTVSGDDRTADYACTIVHADKDGNRGGCECTKVIAKPGFKQQ